MAAIRKDQHEALRDALVAAYPRLEDLRELTDYGLDFDFDVEVQTGGQAGTRELARLLIKWVDARGAVDALFDAALTRRKGNPALQKFAASIGRATVRVTARALQQWSFDLHDYETECRKLIRGKPHPGLRVVLLAGADGMVVHCLAVRLGPVVHRSGDQTHPVIELPLDPRAANIDKAIDRVKVVTEKTARRHVLVKVNADKANSAGLAAFLFGVRAGLPARLTHDLVLLVDAAAELDPPLPDGLADLQLPRPAFDKEQLYEWVEDVSEGQDWSGDLQSAFKGALAAIAQVGKDPSAGDFYYALTEAIECLGGNPDEAALRAWIAEQLARYPSPGAPP